MKKLYLIIMIAALSIPVKSASIWTNQNPYADNNAHKIGDIITILINENATGSTKTDDERKKEVTIGGSSGENAQEGKTIFNSFAKLIPLFGAEAKGKSEYKSNADGQKTGKLIAKISVVIKDINQEGNLILEGEKFVKINNDKQKIIVKGVARPNDISSDNTIYSDKIANADITYSGNVAFSDEKHPGIIKKAFSSIFGFLF